MGLNPLLSHSASDHTAHPLHTPDVHQGGTVPGGLNSRVHRDLLDRLSSAVTLASGPHQEIAVRAPYTGAPLGSIPVAREADVELAFERARAAQTLWEARPLRERARILLRFHDLLMERCEEILDLVQLETGKARAHVFEEIFDTAINARYYALRAGKLLRPRRRRGTFPLFTKAMEYRSPIGVAGFISPWNYPLSLALTDLLPALMAGNGAVLKPDPQASFTALWGLDLLREAGLPADIFQVVTGDGSVGPLLNDRADFIMFTGSTRTGKLVAAQAGSRLVGCSLELGGKNAMLVLADADLEAAVRGAVRGSFVGAGQACISIERIYVHEALLQPFLERFVERTRALRIGPALDYSAEVGSLTTDRQLASVEAHVQDAVEKGATVLCGGRPRPDLGPLFYEPTILTGVGQGMRLYDEETFGPVVAVYGFSAEQDAVARANGTHYGLNASIWTRDAARGVRLARNLRAGSVNVNEAYAATWGSVDAPIGGMKESGLGRRHGAEGILKYTEAQVVAVQRLLPAAVPPGMDPGLHARLMMSLLKLIRHTRVLG